MSQKSGKPNALRHGATSKIVLLWGEKQKDYNTLRDDLCLEWNPDGPTEENLVEQLLYWLWRRRRLDRHEEIEARSKLDSLDHNNMLSLLSDRIRQYAPAFEKADSKEGVENLLSKLPKYYSDIIREKWPLGVKEDPARWGASIAKGMASWHVTPSEGPAEFFVMTNPNDLEKAISVRERIDATIDQTIKKLVQLKAMKQAFRQLEPKLINGPVARRIES